MLGKIKPYDKVHNNVRAKLFVSIEPTPFKNTLCWMYKGYKNELGYGRLRMNGKKVLAHRAMWELFEGEIPEGLCVLHKCDRPSCINISHLFLGTHADNVFDCIKKGRHKGYLNSPFKKGHPYGGKGIPKNKKRPAIRRLMNRKDGK